MTAWLDAISWTSDGLVPVVAQEADTGQVLMVAWMNREALELSAKEGYAIYWSRSRNRLWRKGEESGHRQKIIEMRLDCDADVILLKVEQEGGIACHTGRHHCFYRVLSDTEWHTTEPVLKAPETIYKKG